MDKVCSALRGHFSTSGSKTEAETATMITMSHNRVGKLTRRQSFWQRNDHVQHTESGTQSSSEEWRGFLGEKAKEFSLGGFNLFWAECISLRRFFSSTRKNVKVSSTFLLPSPQSNRFFYEIFHFSLKKRNCVDTNKIFILFREAICTAIDALMYVP